MYRFLSAKLIKDHEMTNRPEVRLKYGQLAGVMAVALNVLLFITKLLTGFAAGSVAIVADGLNNLSDASTNIISLFGFRLASRPADAEHPYGHGRYEYLAGLMVAVLIMVAGVELMKSGVERIFHPADTTPSLLMAAVLIISILIKLWMMSFNRYAGRLIKSKALMATAADSRNDVIATSVVLVGTAVSYFSKLDLDGWLAVGVSAFVLLSGFGLVRDTLSPLIGRKPEKELIDSIRERIMSCPGVIGTHDLMLHDYGPSRLYASAHVEISADSDLMAQHRALEALSRELLENDGLHMVFQLDPISKADTEENRLREYMAERMGVIDPRLNIHDPHISRREDRVLVEFDCYAPEDIDIPEIELKKILGNIVHGLYPDAEVEITLDRDYMAPPH